MNGQNKKSKRRDEGPQSPVLCKLGQGVLRLSRGTIMFLCNKVSAADPYGQHEIDIDLCVYHKSCWLARLCPKSCSRQPAKSTFAVLHLS